ncbi:MAG: DUF4384 domain-containing protein [Planctomycetaceae bacterium]
MNASSSWAAAIAVGGMLLLAGCSRPVVAPPATGGAPAPRQQAPAAEAAAPEVLERTIVRKKLPRNLKSIALEYTVVLVDESGAERPVDPVEHTFDLGDSFLVRIKPEDDLYVYVFNEGPGGERTCLLPAADEPPQRLEAGNAITLPDDGGYFTFEPPAGEEKLLVVALLEPTDDVRLLASVAFKSRAGQGGDDAAEERTRADAAAESLRSRSGAATRTRGPVRKVIERLDGGIGTQTVSHVEPPRDGESSSYGIAIVAEDGSGPELVLDIPLRSRGAAAAEGR